MNEEQTNAREPISERGTVKQNTHTHTHTHPLRNKTNAKHVRLVANEASEVGEANTHRPRSVKMNKQTIMSAQHSNKNTRWTHKKKTRIPNWTPHGTTLRAGRSPLEPARECGQRPDTSANRKRKKHANNSSNNSSSNCSSTSEKTTRNNQHNSIDNNNKKRTRIKGRRMENFHSPKKKEKKIRKKKPTVKRKRRLAHACQSVGRAL